MEPTILTWRPQNFLTVFLMVVLIGVAVAIVGQVVQRVAGQGVKTTSTQTNPQGQ